MKYLYFFLFTFCFAPSCFSQIEKPVEVQDVLKHIDSIQNREGSEFEKLTIKDSLLEVLMIHYEYLSYTSKFELALQTKNKEDRILLYRHIRNYPFYLINSPFYFWKFFNLYVDATQKLIQEYKGNLEELNRLTIVPSAWSQVVEYLKMEIESAGGKWTRGEIPIDTEMLKRGKRGEKD